VTPPLPPDPLASTSAGNDRRWSRVVTAMVRLALLALVLVVGVTPAAAQRGWPQPAAGPSASGAPELVLTFDDGPDPDNTPKVLDVLRARGLRGVFFQVGWRYRRGDVPRAPRAPGPDGPRGPHHRQPHRVPRPALRGARR
jgi:peptidoglycan/xylan/chitin deacetylase (PgdA/CDA1 family)